ncbi:DUF6731 family protein [Hydrogenophaga aquatica]
MSKFVTVNLFDVEWTKNKCQKLSDTLDEFKSLPLDKRWRQDIRLDTIDKVPAEPLRSLPERYHLNFTKRRDIGPGKLGTTAPISDIHLQVGEDFGEETAAIYVPSKKILLVLHNQIGIGPSRMMAYLNALDPGTNRFFDYVAGPRLDNKVMTRLNSMRNILSVDIATTVDALQASADGVALPLAQASRVASAKKVTLRLSANVTRKKTNFLGVNTVVEFVKSMTKQGDDVSKLQIKGEDPTTGVKDQMIDLLRHKVKQTYKASELVVHNHRYTEQSRLWLLDRALKLWI